MIQIDLEKEVTAAQLRGSLLEFSKFFYKHVTGRDFIISNPPGRESHHITVSRALTKVARLETLREIINLPPGSGKSTFVCMFVAWCWAHYPDSNFLYISYSHELAAKHTAFIKQIVNSRLYGYLFDVYVSRDSRAKDAFSTTNGGAIKAFGSGGAVTGQDGGLPGLERMSGGVIIDDAHKPDEAHSDAMREAVIKNYEETIRARARGVNTFMIYIGQRVHEADLTSFLTSDKDIYKWNSTILKSIDDSGNALYPEQMPLETLLEMKQKSPYVFASQYQQDPLPAGGALFKTSDFVLLDEEPELLATFITADTAETDKTWNDATAYSFWGYYEIVEFGKKTGKYGLHWLDCIEIFVEPRDLKDSFIEFWTECARHKMPPQVAAIEKKSTGATLVSVLQDFRAIQIRAIERNIKSGSKTQRFIDSQYYIAGKQISLPRFGKHTQKCIDHMSKITANDTHRRDDIADTAADAIKIALVDKTLVIVKDQQKNVVSSIYKHQAALMEEQSGLF